MTEIKKKIKRLTKKTLTMSDVRLLKHNFDGKPGDFMDNYVWYEDSILYIKDKVISKTWNDKRIIIYELYDYAYCVGYAIALDGKVEYLIGLYSSEGCSLNTKHGLLTCWNDEEIVNLWLDDGEFEKHYIR
jgi:hypothetical protein